MTEQPTKPAECPACGGVIWGDEHALAVRCDECGRLWHAPTPDDDQGAE